MLMIGRHRRGFGPGNVTQSREQQRDTTMKRICVECNGKGFTKCYERKVLFLECESCQQEAFYEAKRKQKKGQVKQ